MCYLHLCAPCQLVLCDPLCTGVCQRPPTVCEGGECLGLCGAQTLGQRLHTHEGECRNQTTRVSVWMVCVHVCWGVYTPTCTYVLPVCGAILSLTAQMLPP